MHIPPTFPFYSVSDIHKEFLTHGYSGRHTEKERDLEARYRHKENERPALIQEETCT